MKACEILLAFAMAAPWVIGAPWHGSQSDRRQSGLNRTVSRRTDREFTNDHQYLHIIAPPKTNETGLPSWPLRTLPVEGPPPEKRWSRPHMNVTGSRPGPLMNSTRKSVAAEDDSAGERDTGVRGSQKEADRTFRFRPRGVEN